MFAQQIARPTGVGAVATFSARPRPAQRSIVARSEKFEKFDRQEKPPPENLSNAAKEINHDSSKAGSNEVDRNPMGGSGLEPAPADGEGQGYSMKEIAENTAGNMDSRDGDTSSGTSSSSSSSFSSMEEAGVQDVE